MDFFDVIVIGAGPAGMAAACAAKDAGAEHVLVLERDKKTGGVLNQCIHDGFGLFHYNTLLTGPEYALLDRKKAEAAGIVILTSAMVTNLTEELVVTVVMRDGVHRLIGGAIVIATGCRERTRGAISIPGARPSGIYTAGTAQRMINSYNIMVGKKVVVLGSGDIGLIMSRRLMLSGAKVECVLEMKENPCGLARNIRLCLYDYNIPLFVSHTISNIYGKDRVCGVEISQTDSNGEIINGAKRYLECDTVIVSAGLIPENELAKRAGVDLDKNNNGVITNEFLQSSNPGIFACGNARKVMDLADFVSEQGYAAGLNAALFLNLKL